MPLKRRFVFLFVMVMLLPVLHDAFGAGTPPASPHAVRPSELPEAQDDGKYQRFVDKDGDGLNDLVSESDSDGDGIPNRSGYSQYRYGPIRSIPPGGVMRGHSPGMGPMRGAGRGGR